MHKKILKRHLSNDFRNEKSGSQRFKSKHRSRASYTTNMVNNNICISEHHIHLPKFGDI